MTAIGYPAIVDDGVNTKSKTVPTVTQGDVSGYSRSGGHKLPMSAQTAAGAWWSSVR